MSTKGQGHSLTLAKGHSDFNFFSQKLKDDLKAQFI